MSTIKYTEEHIDLFSEMFSISREYDTYAELSLKEDGLEEGERDSHYYSASAEITLLNGNRYVIMYGESSDAEEEALNAFNKFVFEFDKDETLLESYLKDSTSFRLE